MCRPQHLDIRIQDSLEVGEGGRRDDVSWAENPWPGPVADRISHSHAERQDGHWAGGRVQGPAGWLLGPPGRD